MWERIKKSLVGEELDLNERIFRLILLVGLFVTTISIFAGLFLENAMANAAPLFCLLITIVISSIATFRYHKTNFAADLFGIMVIGIIFPLMFFVSGGIDGGAATWLVLGLLYIFMMFRGKRLFFFLIIAFVADIGAHIAAYLKPELVVSLGSEFEVYYDSIFAVLTVGLAVGLVMWYQLELYKKERDLTLKQKEEIEQISKSKDAFFTNMSHEIRTPINTIIGLNEMILREDVSDEVAEDALHIKNASKMLLTLINDILDFSQIESERMAIVPVPYRTEEIFGDVVDLLQIRVKEKNLDFYINIDSSLPSEMLGDEVRIKQVLTNLLTNAVKYTPEGSVTLSAQGEIVEDGVERLKISVSDTGIGIKKEDLESLYDYFKRIDRAKNRKIEGSGLGLAITKQLVNLMGGKLTVDSIYTKGTVFTVTLDQSIVNAEPVGKVDFMRKLGKQRNGYYKQSFEAPMARILIVDDNETNLMVAEKLLRATKVRIDKAKSGEECLEKMRKKSYHVVLLDSMMPGLDGMETLKAVRRQESGMAVKTPVIALTANASAGDEQRYLESGFDGYLAKPIDGILMETEILKFLPEDVIEYRIDEEEHEEETVSTQTILRRKHKKIQISTDCVSDLSKKYIERYDLKMMYQYIKTDKGVFRDTVEIDAGNLSRYLSHPDSKAVAVSASVEDYESFFAEALTETEELIHICMSSHAGKSYSNAVAAARGFDHVHVIDSCHVSCGEGLVVLTACNMLANGCNNVEKICNEVNRVREQIESGFIIPDVHSAATSGYANKMVSLICEHLKMYPIIKSRQGNINVSRFGFGKMENAKRRYIRGRLRRKSRIDTRVVFITHAGCTLKQQREFVDEVLKCIPFQKVILEKASVSCASNGGLGTIGMAYLTKKNGEEYKEE